MTVLGLLTFLNGAALVANAIFALVTADRAKSNAVDQRHNELRTGVLVREAIARKITLPHSFAEETTL